jgi:hypothetical protein
MKVAALSLLALATCISPVCAAEAKPNIVFILADDLWVWRPRLLWADEDQDAESRPHGRGRDALHELLRGLHSLCAEPLYIDDG